MKNKVLIVFIVLLLTGCGTRFFYYQLDWLIPFMLRDYISLNSEQKSVLKERLLKQIDWHCKTQLTDYSEALRALSKDISNIDHPIDYKTLNDYYTKFQGFWAELTRQVAPDIAEILRTSTDAQIEELFINLDKRNDELRAEYIDLPPEERVKEREERMLKALGKWLSDPTSDQEQAVSAWSKQLKPMGSEWMQYKDKIQIKVIYLLKKRKDLPDFEQKFIEILTHPGRMRSAAYQAKSDFNSDLTLKLAVKINQMMTAKQRTHLLKRINSLASDFEKIKCDD